MRGREVITPQTAQRIIIKAIRSEVLILTEDDDTAHEISTDIKSRIKGMSESLRVTDSADGVEAAFLEMIYVMSVGRWNSKKRRKFCGLVLMTNDGLKPEYIADGVKMHRLPMIGE